MARFLNLNLANGKPQYTQKDVASEKLEESAEKIDKYDMEAPSLSDLAKAVDSPEKANKAFNFKFIPREKLVFNQRNDFAVNDIEELAKKILENGMLHNLAALYDPDTDTYILESGERRLRACDLAHSRFKDYSSAADEGYDGYLEHVKGFFDNGFPVNVKRAKYQEEDGLSPVDGIDSELRKYTANIDVRTFTPQERAEYTQKVRKLMEEKNRLLYGDNAPKVTQAQVAEATGITERQIRKYEQVQELIPALKSEFENGNLSINKIPTISRMSEEEQLVFLDFLQKKGSTDPVEVKLYLDRAEKAEKEKLELKGEKERIESDLEKLRASRDDEIDKILEESKAKEEKIKADITRAEKEKNEGRIVKLQKELAEEKESASRMIKDTNSRLEVAKESLEKANERITQLESQEANTEQIEALNRVRAELDMNLSFLDSVSGKTLASLKRYKDLANGEDMGEIAMEIRNMKGLKQLMALVGV